ncbi:hypothetical protein DL766_008110 [Monosporascus sp. MC13-8B]|uniref:H15 domain-containing protein n=1 Tax=Monosporascus cannonballus TaxID=155416 RepID=A0ABY0HKG8_9PEZI|nr:hypothetical protein DL763_007585 [Monosporascus cannonballus]RYO92627.1 hypothetical protein DL762_001530 [Monosporascus cannonballus]RYP20728.1 hypothetical protein DL766_008110 [Monosporascus sp. MC13-8B]
MADSNNTNESAGGKWTDAEKASMMVQIIEQLTSAGGKVRLGELNMPGRTTKSLTHMLGKIKEEAALHKREGGSGSGSVPATPKAKGGAKKGASSAPGSGTGTGGRKRTKTTAAATGSGDEDEKDGDYGDAASTKKRQRRTPASKKRAPVFKSGAKAEDTVSEDGEDEKTSDDVAGPEAADVVNAAIAAANGAAVLDGVA